MRHIGGPKWGILGGGQKFRLKKFMCFFRPLSSPTPLWPEPISVELRSFNVALKAPFLVRGRGRAYLKKSKL